MIQPHMQDRRWHLGPVAAILVLAAALVVGCAGGASTTAPSNASAAPSVAAAATATIAATAVPTARARAAASIGPSPVPSDGRESGEARVDAWGIEQLWVPAGTFRMGTSAAAIAAILRRRHRPNGSRSSSRASSRRTRSRSPAASGSIATRSPTRRSRPSSRRAATRPRPCGPRPAGHGWPARTWRACRCRARATRPEQPRLLCHLVRGRGLRDAGAPGGCRRRRSGNTRRAVPSRRSIRGATGSTPPWPTSSTAPARWPWAASRTARAGSARSTWPATRWNGSPTG